LVASDELSTDDARAPWLAPLAAKPGPDDLVLVVAWSSGEPSRIGEAARLRADGLPRLLGRGDAAEGDDCPRLRFFRERPFALEECGPLGARGISRRHLRLCATPRGAVEFEQLGGGGVLHNGVPRTRGAMAPGDTLALKDQLLLFLVTRPAMDSCGTRFTAGEAGAFGAPDAYGLVGESAAMWRLRNDLAFLASATGHTLVLGPSGVGKELAVRAAHAMAARRGASGIAGRPFIARSAASFPTTLIDAELFGNVRNFPNPGMSERPGLVGAADGGTLFLDEIGEFPSELQAHLLRVLDRSGEYHRLGEAIPRRSAFRMIAATNRAPESLKSDLAARFALRVRIPDLNERREDIPLLVADLMEDARACAPDAAARFFGHDAPRAYPRLDPSFMDALLRRTYSTHVRELGAILWQSIAASRHGCLEPIEEDASLPDHAETAETRSELTEEAVRQALLRHRGSTSRAFRELGLSSRYALYRLMKKYDISPTPPNDS
jgi:two-component system nitrogen regulation response regulator GlnG/two-component system response regulator HydG